MHAVRKHTQHLCEACAHKWVVSPQVQGNPLAGLGVQLLDDGLWITTLPSRGRREPPHGVAGELRALVPPSDFVCRAG